MISEYWSALQVPVAQKATVPRSMMKVIMLGEKEEATPVRVSKIEQMRMDLFLPNLSEVRPHTMEDPILLAMYTEEDTDLNVHSLNYQKLSNYSKKKFQKIFFFLLELF